MSTENKYSKFAVLYVDDEEQALKYFGKILGREFQVLTANSVATAMEILEKDHEKIGVVLTDQRMPNGNGTDLLKQVHTKWPKIVRMMVTAYSELDLAVEAVNAGQIFKYLTKPVDFPQLRETLKAAMDMFLTQGERDSLLQIKMSSLRRMVVEDRVRSLAKLTFGLAHHLRNSMTAMGCFLEEMDPANDDAPPSTEGLSPAAKNTANQLWSLAVQERNRLLTMLERVIKSVVEPVCEFASQMDAEDLLKKAAHLAQQDIAPRKVSVELGANNLGKLQVDEAKITQLIKILVSYVARHTSPDGTVTISLKGTTPLWETTAIQFFISGAGLNWSDEDVATFFTPFAFPKSDPSELGLGLLNAFSIAHQHGGEILVHRAAPNGPGFEVLLPMNPQQVKRPSVQENLLETVFT